jgi:uncharacterized protein (DUF983 family)
MIPYLRNRCPRCEQAPIFNGIYRMNSRCTSCGEVFERESGYFIGAMIASYFIGVFTAFPVLLVAIFLHDLPIGTAIVIAILQVLALQPFLFRYSRILWIRIEARLTHSIHGKGAGKE